MNIDKTLAERGARYGDFTDHAELAQALQEVMHGRGEPFVHDGWDKLTADKKQALTVIADKIARILTGDPEYADNWHDIQGYAKLAEVRCRDTQTADMFSWQPNTLGAEATEWAEWFAPTSYTDEVEALNKQHAQHAASRNRPERYKEKIVQVDTRSAAEKGYENGN